MQTWKLQPTLVSQYCVEEPIAAFTVASKAEYIFKFEWITILKLEFSSIKHFWAFTLIIRL